MRTILAQALPSVQTLGTKRRPNGGTIDGGTIDGGTIDGGTIDGGTKNGGTIHRGKFPAVDVPP
ncbi:hypothetical protein J421_0765 [Gemmatirosa kalamazoonensis]|uniref:Uncharacterized protein n=1 Tax=Gemmatirosa kalamazoonensis TaxID=861299 RepID=W0RCZ3_9BACT|nr:hypothetical protein J421_0765 [Gemmatirosa kalamazoonensis]